VAVDEQSPPPVDLTPYRRRIRLLRVWRLAATGGCIGACVAALALVSDRLDLIDLKPWQTAILVALGIAAGAAAGLFERYSDTQIARSIDRRSALDDRLTTAYEVRTEGDSNADLFIDAVRSDTARRMADLSPKRLYPLRFHSSHGLLAALACLCALLYMVFDTALIKSPTDRAQAQMLKQASVQVQAIARPLLADARQPGATAADKQLARDLEKFARDLQKARISKQEALIRANQLSEQAQKLEAQHTNAFSGALDKAQTAGEKLKEVAANTGLQKTDSAKLAYEAANLQRQMAALQQQLNAARAGHSHLSLTEQKALEQKLAEMEKLYRSIRLSQDATDRLNKLAALPDFQEDQEILSKLQEQANAEQQDEPGQLTPEQMRQMAARLEALAKQLGNDEAMKEYARDLLEAAKRARLGHGQCSGKLLSAFGLCNSPGFGLKGRGSTAPGVWMGGIGHLSKTDKTSLLNIKFQDRMITSQKGAGGPETYTQQVGPAQIGPRTGIPYQNILPKYEKTAESALKKGDIPPQMRTQVRDYFASLHNGQQ